MYLSINFTLCINVKNLTDDLIIYIYIILSVLPLYHRVSHLVFLWSIGEEILKDKLGELKNEL